MKELVFSRVLSGYCRGSVGCPAILEVSDGDFAVIGKDVTDAAKKTLPEGTGCKDDERVVQIPRKVLIAAQVELLQSQGA